MSVASETRISLPMDRVETLNPERMWAVFNLLTELLGEFNPENLEKLIERLREFNDLVFVAESLQQDTQQVDEDLQRATLQAYRSAIHNLLRAWY